MGDRANIKVLQNDGTDAAVYLYAHNGGSNLPDVLQTVIQRKKRWDDHPYLTRMIFCEMVKGWEGEETGYGISNGICDNEHHILVVDCETQTISLEGDEFKWTFAEFCDLDLEEVLADY